jgi:hypothetical protein
MGCVLLLAGVAVVSARGERELTDEELRAEMSMNREMAAYVARNGEPDLAESHSLSDTPPWDDHEVTLYYLDMRKEIGFARAWILGRPEVHVQRYERPLSDEQIAALSSRVQRPRSLTGLGPAERAEESARRAEAAAGKVEAAADAAERAADKTEAIASRMESAFHRALRK